MRPFHHHLLAGVMISSTLPGAEGAEETARAALPAPGLAPAGQWSQFRGHRARGILPDAGLPIRWHMGKQENVRWQTGIKGLGHASPIVWGDRVYLATAVTEGVQELDVKVRGDVGSARDNGVQQWRLLAIDKATGAILFNKLGFEGKPKVKRHTKATHCNSTPATDGKNLVAIFGSEGLFCFDMEGELRWRKDLGPMDAGWFRVKTAQWGFGSSPVIHDGKVVVLCDVQEGSFLAVYQLEDGRELWKRARKDVPTWGTPTIVEHEGRTQILVNGWHHTGAYDFESGEEIWKLQGGGDIPVPTPVTAHGNVFLSNAHGRYSPMRAVRLSARGEITLRKLDETSEHIPWVHGRKGAYMATPIVVGKNLYSCDGGGVLTCFDAASGEIRYRERIGQGGGGFTASPVSDGSHLFFAGETGKVFVVKAGDEFSVAAENELDDTCLASPALAEGMLFFRTRFKLIAIGTKGGK
ncbi:MAG: pyrrolo-quinoline quinone [Roseibacillus sp.]|nr:pyrrolo-quinoline quinone [Roseibacillus sp.]